MEVEYELTLADLYAFQWRAVYNSALGRRITRKVYLGWFLALLLFSLVPAIGPDGFVLSSSVTLGTRPRPARHLEAPQGGEARSGTAREAQGGARWRRTHREHGGG